MRFALLLACVCVAASLAADVKEDVKKTVDKSAKAIDESDKKEQLIKHFEAVQKIVLKEDGEEPVKLPDSEKTWGQAVNAATPTAEVFSANIHMYSDLKIKPEIASAFNLEEELAYWNKQGNPSHLEFIGDDGPSFGVMTSHQPVFLTSYSDDIKFHLFRKYNESDITGVVIDDVKKAKEYGFDPKLPVKVVIHGFTNSIKSDAIQLIKNAFLETGDYNVIGVDWGNLCRGPWYPGARAHVTGAGVRVGEFLDALIENKFTEPAMIHVIGHSLGAHVAGISGKSMKSAKVARITGMDPAGPLFQLTNDNGIIVKTDANLVDIIHTNAGLLGKSKHLGHVDFYPNGGHFQPGCPVDITGACSHGRSYEMFASTIKHPDILLEGVYCPALPKQARACEIMLKDNKATDKAVMGYNLKFQKEGAYFLKTTDQPAFKFSF